MIVKRRILLGSYILKTRGL